MCQDVPNMVPQTRCPFFDLESTALIFLEARLAQHTPVCAQHKSNVGPTCDEDGSDDAANAGPTCGKMRPTWGAMAPTWGQRIPMRTTCSPIAHGPNIRQDVPNVVAQGGTISKYVSPTATARHTKNGTRFTTILGCK